MLIEGHFTTNIHRALKEIEPNYLSLPGLVIGGTHDPNTLENEKLIILIEGARKNGIPYLGICYGAQLAVIEWYRNEEGIGDANTEELGKGEFVVHKRPEGMRVGVYGGESWWSEYESDDFPIPPNFILTPYHPEYQSCKDRPHPKLVEFIELCKKKK